MTKEKRQNKIGRIRLITVILFLGFVAGGFFYPRFTAKTFGSNPAEEIAATPTPPRNRRQTRQTRQPRVTEFSHSTKAHKKDCSTCHKFPSANWKTVRKGSDAFPDITDYPKHESCLSCHRQDFFGRRNPTICSVCHTNPGPRNSARHPFPNPREAFDKSAKGRNHITDFEIDFPHDKHIEIVSENETEESVFTKASFVSSRKQTQASCAVCHQTYLPQGESDMEFIAKPPAKWDVFWLKKGTFKTSPIGHAQCFTCHSQEAGIEPAPTNCATCHKLGKDEIRPDFDQTLANRMGADKIMLWAWRSRHSSATFRHEFSSHADMDCAACHNVDKMDTREDKSMKVAITSCNMCHITATVDDGGALNFEVEERRKNAKFECVKCHVSYGKLPIPESHRDAIKAAQ